MHLGFKKIPLLFCYCKRDVFLDRLGDNRCDCEIWTLLIMNKINCKNIVLHSLLCACLGSESLAYGLILWIYLYPFVIRMIETGKEFKTSLPDEESFDLVVSMLLSAGQIDAALKCVDLTLKSGYMLSLNAFTQCVSICVTKGMLDTLVSILDRCKVLLV